MKLRNLTIKNFRGIREMEWNLKGNFACLIGPGDSTKSTVLLAMEYLFSQNWNLFLSEVDFYQRDTSAQIEICAVITELPKKLTDEDKFGLYLGFWNPVDGTLHEKQKAASFQKALKICLTIKNDLEPKWEVISLQSEQSEGRELQMINAADRRMLGVTKIGTYTEADLTWGRNSALSRMTDKNNMEQIPASLVNLESQILNTLQNADLSALSETIQNFKRSCQTIGVDTGDILKANIDPSRVSLRQSAIALFDGNLPLTLRGAGSRRLMAMAAHKDSVPEGAILLIDEIENCLEPYRLRHLIRQVRPQSEDTHQMIFTTHSSVAVVECKSDELYVVRSEHGKTFVQQVGAELQDMARKVPEAFLARRVVVCEGKTEAGFLIGLDENYWQINHAENSNLFKYQTMAEAGIAPVEDPRGGGDDSPRTALALVELGYQVSFFGDSDKVEKLTPSVDEMKQKGIEVVLWDKDGDRGVSIEERLCLDLPLTALQELVELAIELNDNNEQFVWDAISSHLQDKSFAQNRNFEALKSKIEESELKKALGKSAKGKHEKGEKGKDGWFKRRDKGEAVGRLVARYLSEMEDTPTMQTLKALEVWCYA